MATSPVRIDLGTEPGQHRIVAASFLTALDAELEILSEVNRELSANKLVWYVTHLEVGSGIATVQGDWTLVEGDPLLEDPERRRELEKEIPRQFVVGMRTLDRDMNVWRRSFSHRALDAAGRLASVLQNGVISIHLTAPELQESTVLSERVLANVKTLETQRFTDLGSVEGTMVSISLARRPYTFSVREQVHQRLIPCAFVLDQLENVRTALLKRVSVRGYISYSEEGIPVRLSGIQELTVLEAPSKFDRARFFGLDRDFTDGIPAAVFVNRGWRDREGQ